MGFEEVAYKIIINKVNLEITGLQDIKVSPLLIQSVVEFVIFPENNWK